MTSRCSRGSGFIIASHEGSKKNGTESRAFSWQWLRARWYRLLNRPLVKRSRTSPTLQTNAFSMTSTSTQPCSGISNWSPGKSWSSNSFVLTELYFLNTSETTCQVRSVILLRKCQPYITDLEVILKEQYCTNVHLKIYIYLPEVAWLRDRSQSARLRPRRFCPWCNHTWTPSRNPMAD